MVYSTEQENEQQSALLEQATLDHTRKIHKIPYAVEEIAQSSWGMPIPGIWLNNTVKLWLDMICFEKKLD